MKTINDCNLKSIIGNTPLLEINFQYKGAVRTIYAKHETFNMTGSIKDRMAYHIIKKSYAEGTLKKGDEIVEATSGNTGIAFSAIGASLGHKVKIFMPDWMSEERKKLISSFGAEIHLVSKEEGGFLGSIAMAEKYAEENENVFLPRQFENEYNAEAHYSSTAPEIVQQMQNLGLRVDGFVAGVGTGGTVMGVGRYLKEKNPQTKVYPLEPSNSPTLTTGHKVGKHRIQGISDEFIPALVDLKALDRIIQVDDGDAIIMAQKFAQEFGLGLGISSGANFIGALIAQEELGQDKNVVTVFADSNKKYLSTDLCGKEPVKDGFYSTDIKLLDFKLLPQVF
ncbi:MAG: cysteine synthase family protein [Flavobacteriaceae bacterium]|nr:cysteine synthase family protein [Flavobacteriaceae bacterium]